jgi:parallel beta-helix repeat protein
VRSKQLFISLILGLGLTLALLWLLGDSTPSAHAVSPHYVASDCTGVPAPCHTSIQEAVDAAVPGDEILVASGVYTDVNVRPRNDITTTGVVTQVVYISKTVTVRGGYNADFSTWDPDTYSTTLDVQGQGRVVYITGDISPTIEGLRVTGGNATELGSVWNENTGGGMYVITATTTISNNWVFSNTAEHGGGLFLSSSAATLSANTVMSNTADYNGGGLSMWYSDARLSENTLASNNCSNNGGGLYLFRSDATLSRNTITGNTASDWGGGLCLQASEAMLRDNIITANVSGNKGGGLRLLSSPATLNNNIVSGNTAYSGGGLNMSHSHATLNGNIVTANAAVYGGGLLLWMSDATIVNNFVADNQANAMGSGLYVESSSPQLLHTTIARNADGDGSGVHVTYGSPVALTNTILVSHTVGITVAEGNTVTLESTLWYSNTTADWGGAGTIITGTHNYWDDPAFVNPDAGDYHIGLTSAAIDKGVNAGVGDDIDGDSRPQGSGYDLGADEFLDAASIYLPLLMRQYP